MEVFDIIAIVVTLAAVYAYINYRYLKLPTSIGLMLLAMVSSVIVVAFSIIVQGLTMKRLVARYGYSS